MRAGGTIWHPKVRHFLSIFVSSLLVTTTVPGNMATKIIRKRESYFFEYDCEKHKSKCLVMETGGCHEGHQETDLPAWMVGAIHRMENFHNVNCSWIGRDVRSTGGGGEG